MSIASTLASESDASQCTGEGSWWDYLTNNHDERFELLARQTGIRELMRDDCGYEFTKRLVLGDVNVLAAQLALQRLDQVLRNTGRGAVHVRDGNLDGLQMYWEERLGHALVRLIAIDPHKANSREGSERIHLAFLSQMNHLRSQYIPGHANPSYFAKGTLLTGTN